MSGAVTSAVFEKSLRGAGVHFTRMPLSGGYSVIVTEHWGKIFGPFSGDDDPGLLWLSPKAAEAQGLRDMKERGDWCIGGDRIWLAPEVQFNIPDRVHWDSDGAYVLPRAVDPGQYRMETQGDTCVSLEQRIDVALHNLAAGSKKLRIKRTVRPALDPLRRSTGYAAVKERVSAGRVGMPLSA